MNSWRDLQVDTLDEANVFVGSVSFDKNVSIEDGARFAPERLRHLSQFLPPASKDGIDLTTIRIYDFGDIGTNDTEFPEIEEKAKEIYMLNQFTVMLGGDHSASIPLEHAFYEVMRKKNKIPAIIHIDAHPDYCDVYHESKFSHACPNYRAYEHGYDIRNIVLMAVRGFELQELHLFSEHPEIEVIKASELVKNGVRAIRHLKDRFDDRYAIYLSFDIDSLDPAYAPGTGTPEAFGLSTELTNEILTFLVTSLPVKAMDIMEISPRLDINNITSWTALKLLYEIFAAMIIKKQEG